MHHQQSEQGTYSHPTDPVFANPRSQENPGPIFLKWCTPKFFHATPHPIASLNCCNAKRNIKYVSVQSTSYCESVSPFFSKVSCTRFGIRTDGNGQDHVPGCHCETRSHCPGIPTRASTSRHRHDAEATLSAHRCLLPICPHEILNPPNESSADRVSE
jgi:hypothetical protein